jgi:hypothetical protein
MSSSSTVVSESPVTTPTWDVLRLPSCFLPQVSDGGQIVALATAELALGAPAGASNRFSDQDRRSSRV